METVGGIWGNPAADSARLRLLKFRDRQGQGSGPGTSPRRPGPAAPPGAGGAQLRAEMRTSARNRDARVSDFKFPDFRRRSDRESRGGRQVAVSNSK